jgi:hypothetical protein
MVSVLGPEADARAVIEPKPGPFGLFVGYLEPLLQDGLVQGLVGDQLLEARVLSLKSF